MKVKVKVKLLSHVRLCNPIDCIPPGSSIHWIFQARVLEWVAIPFSRGSSWPRDQTLVPHIAGRCFTVWATREAPSYIHIHIYIYTHIYIRIHIYIHTYICSFPEYYGISNALYSCTSKFQVNEYEVSKKMAGFGSFISFLFYILEPQRREIVSEEDAYKAYQGSVSRGSLISLCVREKLAIVLSLQLSSLSLTPLMFQVHSSLVL